MNQQWITDTLWISNMKRIKKGESRNANEEADKNEMKRKEPKPNKQQD